MYIYTIAILIVQLFPLCFCFVSFFLFFFLISFFSGIAINAVLSLYTPFYDVFLFFCILLLHNAFIPP